MDKKLIPGTIIFCVEAAILGVVLMGGALCAVDAVKKEREKEMRLRGRE